MSSLFRTASAGLGALVVCLAMASLKWQFLLVGFAFVSVVWGLRSCSIHARRSQQRKPFGEEPAYYSRRHRPGRQDNVLSFPMADWATQGVSDASGS